MITDTDFNLVRKLNDYVPKDTMFTSKEEKEHIEKTLCLHERDVLSLRNLRNCVVMNHNIRRLNHDDASMEGLMSITTVIDNYITEKGGEV